MYSKPPDAADLAKMEHIGLSADDYPEEVVEIWPENLPAYNLFNALVTQWRVGMGGATGLDYGVVPLTMRMMGIPRSEWPALFEDVRVMEREALGVMRGEQG